MQYLHRCPRKLGDELGLIGRRGFLRGRRDTFSTAGSICVAGVVLSEEVESLASCQPFPCHELEGEEVHVEAHEENTIRVEWPLLIGKLQ